MEQPLNPRRGCDQFEPLAKSVTQDDGQSLNIPENDIKREGETVEVGLNTLEFAA